MEAMGAMLEGEWSSLSGMYTTEEADFMAQLLGNSSFPNELPQSSSFGVPSTFCLGHESTMDMARVDNGLMYCSDNANTNMYSFSQGISYRRGGSILFPTSSHESYYPSVSHHILDTNNNSVSMDYCTGEDRNNSSPVQTFTDKIMEVNDCLNQDISSGSTEESGRNLPVAVLHGKYFQLERESEMPKPEPSTEDNNNLLENSKKRSRISGDVQKNNRNLKSKKNEKLVSTSNNDEDNNALVHRQCSSRCWSEDDSNASQELNGGVTSSSISKGATTLNLKGKTRVSRGSATDPQSLYARKRRERINERLKILQTLVPNGTKVDISTMLEEAVQYVKFLQLQIKLLSSDDLWMYAPIAYNGMDIGLST